MNLALAFYWSDRISPQTETRPPTRFGLDLVYKAVRPLFYRGSPKSETKRVFSWVSLGNPRAVPARIRHARKGPVQFHGPTRCIRAARVLLWYFSECATTMPLRPPMLTCASPRPRWCVMRYFRCLLAPSLHLLSWLDGDPERYRGRSCSGQFRNRHGFPHHDAPMQ